MVFCAFLSLVDYLATEPDGQPPTLAPDIVAAILDEALPPGLTLFDLAVDPLALWEEQRKPVDIILVS